MTIFNIISIVVFLVIAGFLLYAWFYMHKEVGDADGAGSVNERGEAGTSTEGDIVREI